MLSLKIFTDPARQCIVQTWSKHSPETFPKYKTQSTFAFDHVDQVLKILVVYLVWK